MKKSNPVNIVLIIIFTIALTAAALTGCSKSTAAGDTAQAPAPSTDGSGNAPQGRGFNQEEMKKQVQSSIQSLVDDGTITKDQAAKIEEAYFPNTGRPGGQPRSNNGQQGGRQANGQNDQQNGQQGNSQNNQQNDQQGSGQNAQQDSQPNGQQNNGQGGRQGRARFNPLSKLVEDGTITQAQADKVMQKIQEGFPRRNDSSQPSGT